MKCSRAPAATFARLKAPSLPAALRTLQSQYRCRRTSSRQHSNVPPPLTATPLRRSAANRRIHARRASTTIAAPSSSAIEAHATATPQWTDMLALCTAGGPPSRVTLSEVAALCLRTESPKCYGVYRPCASGRSSSRNADAAPYHFVELLQHLRTAPSLSIEARRVAGVLVDQLNKVPHPRYPGPWDVTRQEVRDIKAAAIAHVMECLSAGDEALPWLARFLGLTDTLAEVVATSSGSMQPTTLVQVAVIERIKSRDSAATAHRVHVSDPDGDWLLSCSSTVVGAIAAAMLSSTAGTVKAGALELLEVAALSRLTRGPPAPSSAVVSGSLPAAAQPAEAAVLFNEAVAVHCAEAAAVRGDVETVTRLIFLLYRARGALGCATLTEHRQQRRSNRGSRDNAQRWGVGGLLPRSPAWRRFKWWGRDSLPRETDLAEGDDADVRFEQAVVRLLKSVMHAALYHPQRSGDPTESSTEEALSLWNGLRGGTSWSGLAAMAAELLAYLVDQHMLLTAAGEGKDLHAADTCLQKAGLHVYTHLYRAAAPRHRTSAQQEVLGHCAALMMRLFSTPVVMSVESSDAGRCSLASAAVPTVSTITSAEHLLRLFAYVDDTSQQEALLPYALAASLTVLSTAATLKVHQLPAALFSGLTRFFSVVQSLLFYCVASGDTVQAPLHTAVCGSYILLHAFLLSHAPLGAWAREDGELASLVQRLRGLDGVVEGGDMRQRDGQAAQLFAWLRVSGHQQRQLLWSLLLSLKRRDAHWCGATLSLFASPASSTAAFAAAAAALKFSSLPPAELRTVMSLLYECGNTDDPVRASETLDYVVSSCAQMPIRTLTLSALTEQLKRKCVVDASGAVLVLTKESLRAIVQRCEPADESAFDDQLERLVCLLQPLLRESAARAAPSFVFIVLTPACLMELQRLRMKGEANAPRGSIGFVQALHAALSGNAAHQLYQVMVASSWPLLPSMVTALSQHSDLRAAADGLRETTAAARHLEKVFPRESRPAVCLWTEEEFSPSTLSSVSAVRVSLLGHYGAREVSTHRANVEKAKSDILSLLRSTSSANSRQSELRVSAEVSSAEASAARRVRNKSLLSAVLPTRNGQRTL
ncbi:hypothetical protein ABL78_2333 [Leptomonas seymouri]|uniref:Uncharacterized protein n=1 Tax=Leptomonas seymouri TaxID=5684 RepID=A0A0N1I662_LEPSE|nr:hypothetical protein ABL78_2333 [Leptomonas seymouri]|eukprot:KPI88521.1 hypothetical protein ABL78_2333 [Leptomonas seymouri]